VKIGPGRRPTGTKPDRYGCPTAGSRNQQGQFLRSGSQAEPEVSVTLIWSTVLAIAAYFLKNEVLDPLRVSGGHAGKQSPSY
jgi:hypothetical protein